MSRIIPKEQQTAYQRWELASFGDDRPATVSGSEAAALALANELRQANEETRIAGYTTGMEQGRTTGFEQGHKAGLEQGYAEGLAQGLAEGLAKGRAQGTSEIEQLRQITAVFGNEIAQASERIAEDVLDLALDLSKAMLKNALTVRPELVIPIVTEAIRYLPALQHPALLYLHPEDAKIVQTLLGDELARANWRIVDDEQMDRGGCRVDTSSNKIDSTTTTRWQRITAALGKESDWLAP